MEDQKKFDIDAAADEVLIPPPRNYRLKGKGGEQVIALLPLPIYYSKRVNRTLLPISNRVADLKKKIKEIGEDAAADDPLIDLDFIDAVVACAGIILEFYGIKTTTEQIERDYDVKSLCEFMATQLEVCNRNDFLLQPLSAAVLLLQNIVNVGELYTNLRHLAHSAKDGKFPTENSSQLTPTDS